MLPRRACQTSFVRRFRASPPTEVGPLIAGIGIAAVAYGTKLLIEAASNPKFQEAVRETASAAAKAASDTASAARQAAAAKPAEPAATKEPRSYFTTDVMASIWGRAPRIGAVAAPQCMTARLPESSRTSRGSA